MYVLDDDLQPVPIGVPGELYIGGLGIARGYLGQPGLTAERFIPNPFREGERMYITGDIVRWLRDGVPEYLGREDDQVKVRGYRIELGEIESVLVKENSIAESVVITKQGDDGRNQLVAYVVLEEGNHFDAGEIRNYLGEHLPGFMVPAFVIRLDEIPLLPSGKTDRKALLENTGILKEVDGEYQEPRTEEEKVMAEIWGKLLGLERVGVRDNFFELGGDSILSIQIVAQAQEAGMRVSPQQLFQYPTIEGLTSVAEKKARVEAEQGLVTGEVELTPIQKWFFEQDQPEKHHWNQAVMVKVKGGMEREVLEKAVRAVTRHHDVLRSRYREEEGEWKAEQEGEEREAGVRWEDLIGIEGGKKREKLEASAAENQGSLDLEEGPVMRVVYYEMGEEEEDRLLVVVHHLVVDGVSWRIILEDLMRAYEQEERGEEVELPAKTTSYKKWSEKIGEYAQGEEIGEEKGYWLSGGEGDLEGLPVDGEGGENLVGEMEVLQVEMGEGTTRALLQEVPPVYNTKIQEVLLTAMVKAFSRWTGKNELKVDLEGHGRVELFEDVDLSRTVGWFTSLYPVRLGVEPGKDPGEALKEVKEQMRAIPREGIGYGMLRYKREEEGLREEIEEVGGAEVSFNYLGQMDQVMMGSEKISPAEEDPGMPFSPRGRRGYLIDVVALVMEKKLRMNWTYSPIKHKRETVERLAEGYLEELEEIITHCQSPDAGGYTPSDFPDVELEQDELDELLAELDDSIVE
jgi:non-ribosomal peptide synthase protein (TIGR01720 family)